MIAPLGAPVEHEAVRAGAEVYRALRGHLAKLGHATGLGDEGWFAPGTGQLRYRLWPGVRLRQVGGRHLV